MIMIVYSRRMVTPGGARWMRLHAMMVGKLWVHPRTLVPQITHCCPYSPTSPHPHIIPHQLAALFNCFILLTTYLSKCNALQLLHYNTTLNAFCKSEFHLIGYSYSITRAQQAKVQCMLGVARPHMPPGASRKGGAERGVW